MSRYVIGDIQGCYDKFLELIFKINFNSGVDSIYLVGDLVNRGPKSLDVLKWVYKYKDSVTSVLGNHDIYLLGRFKGVLENTEYDTLSEVINNKSSSKLINHLRSFPLIINLDDYIIVHAGIYPKINFNILYEYNKLIHTNLTSKNYSEFIKSVYSNKPKRWDASFNELKKMIFTINSCTRMRYLNADDFSLDFSYKGSIADKPESLIPWFKVEFDKSIDRKIIFGHWATLGLFHTPKYISIDTGCVWGRKLTAFNLDTFEITQV